ncbi:MAG: DUF4093 domain-containing protein [Clostridia bacterium]|nr:DUF4093 domain-containing protein [Clostridia bacterium]
MISLNKAVVVEGKFDKQRLGTVLDAYIITTDGFGIFNDNEKKAFIKALAKKQGLLVLTDSDRAGFKIRAYLRGLVPSEQIEHAYIPERPGKERRKSKPSKDGLLGVEGIDEDTLRTVLEPFICARKSTAELTKADLYDIGLLGQADSANRRSEICKKLSLPSRMSSNAFLEAVNTLCSPKELLSLCAGDKPAPDSGVG